MSIQSLDRALDILEYIASHTAPVPLKIIAEQMNLPVSTVHNLVRTMVNRGYISHVGARGGFILGYELVELASAVPIQFQITEVVKPYVMELYEVSGKESAYFSVMRKDIISSDIYIPSSYALSVSLGVNTLDKLYCSSQGKLFMAYMTPEQLNRYLKTHPLIKLGPNTITDEALLREEMEKIRKQGYSINQDESEAGACGIAAPILNWNGHIAGAIAVGLPSIRMVEKKDALIKAITGIAAEINRKLVAEMNEEAK